jgi:predicted nucleic acid-binding protein
MTYLIDTDVVAELRKPADRRHPGVTAWAEQTDPDQTFLSALTVAELGGWITQAERTHQVHGEALDRWFTGQVLTPYRRRILPVDLAIGLRAGRLKTADPLDFRDALIAATALEHYLTVVTGRPEGLAATGVSVLNPFV